jgi:transposase InsO family protein
VLREQGCQIPARTYRSWKDTNRPVAARTLSDAQVLDAVRDLAGAVDDQGRRKLTPEGLHGRRKMTALVRRRKLPDASFGAVDRAMRSLGLSGLRRDKGIRTTIPAKDGKRAGDLLDRDFTAAAPNRIWVTDFTYVRTWAGFVYVAFILDVFAQRIVGRVHPRRVRPADRGLACRHHQGDRPGDDPTADGCVAAPPRRPPDRAGRADLSLRRRLAGRIQVVVATL